MLKSMFMKKNLIVIAFASLLLASFSASAKANKQQQAMAQAEKITSGKAVKAKRIQRDGKQGYQVRVIKNGVVSHVFIALESL